MTPCRATDCDRQSTRRGLCNRCYMREYSRQHAYGRWKSGHVDAQPVRDHLNKLQAAGLGMRVIAEQTGVARSTLRAILNGKKRATSEGSKIEPPRHHVIQATAQAILAVALPTPLDPRIPDNTPVDATGTRRRLRALAAIGWTHAHLGACIGWSTTNLNTLLHRDRVNAHTARMIAELYDQLALAPGPSTSAMIRAQRKGWRKPLDWDDDLIDIPTATPAEPTPTTTTDRLDDLEWLLHCGENPDTAAARCGWSTYASATRAAHRNARKLPTPQGIVDAYGPRTVTDK